MLQGQKESEVQLVIAELARQRFIGWLKMADANRGALRDVVAASSDILQDLRQVIGI